MKITRSTADSQKEPLSGPERDRFSLNSTRNLDIKQPKFLTPFP